MAFGWLSDAVSWTGDQLGLGGRPSEQNRNRVNVDEAVPQSAFQSERLAQHGDAMWSQGENYQNRAAPQMDAQRMAQFYGYGDAAQNAQRGLGGQQQAYINQLQGVANGTAGPSAAELSMQRASQDTAQQQLMLAQAAGGGPGGAAAAIRAQNQNATAQGALTRDLGVQRAEEQATARQMLGQAMTDTRGQELSAGGLYSGMGANMEQANQQAQLEQTGLDDAMRQFYYGGALQADQGLLDASVAGGQTRADYLGNQESADASRYSTREGAQGQRFGATVGMIGSGLAAFTMSDVRAKENIRPARLQLDEGFRGLPDAYGYEYRNPQRYGTGPQVGVMAQDLERNPALRHTVETGPDGMKRIDGGRLATATAAEVAQQRREIDELQQRARPETRGQKAIGALARGLGAFGATMNGGSNAAGAALDARAQDRVDAQRELDDLEEQNRRDEEYLSRLGNVEARQTAAIRQPQVSYPTVQPSRFGYTSEPGAPRAPNRFGFGATTPMAYSPAPPRFGY